MEIIQKLRNENIAILIPISYVVVCHIPADTPHIAT